MSGYTLVVEHAPLPALVIHGGAGAYLKTTTVEQRLARGKTLADVTRAAHLSFGEGGARATVLAAIEALEDDPGFNAGWGSRLQQDGEARLSAGLMDGSRTRMSAILNARRCLHPTALADVLQNRADRNLDGDGAKLLMAELGIAERDVRAPLSIERWRKLVQTGDTADREAAIGSAGEEELDQARAARLAVPDEIAAELDGDEAQNAEGTGSDQVTGIDDENKYGTVGAVAADPDGGIWAATSTGGRGHEAVGRVSDTPTVAGNYACPEVALSATGFGEQIIDLNVCGRIATRVIDGLSLEDALRRTFDEVATFGGLLGVIAVTPKGELGYAHTTEACGVAWMDGAGALHIDRHGR